MYHSLPSSFLIDEVDLVGLAVMENTCYCYNRQASDDILMLHHLGQAQIVLQLQSCPGDITESPNGNNNSWILWLAHHQKFFCAQVLRILPLWKRAHGRHMKLLLLWLQQLLQIQST